MLSPDKPKPMLEREGGLLQPRVRTAVASLGRYLPRRIVKNEELASSLQTNDAWIQSRTGIRQRHIADDNETTSDLALAAARIALSRAGCTASSIDAIVLATTTPENTFPATAARVQAKLGGGRDIPAFDVQAVCSGFIFALSLADNMIRLRQARKILVIGAEIYSRIVDWGDRSTCILFGDGAGAFLLEGVDEEEGRGILDCLIKTNGDYYDALFVDGGAGSNGKVGKLRMEGKIVFRHAIEKMSQSVLELLSRNGFTTSDVAWLVPHQANQRIMASVARNLGIDEARVVSSVAEHGNISAATIPAALFQAADKGMLKKGDLVALTALGGGFSWGAVLLRW